MNKQVLMKFCENAKNPRLKEPWSSGDYSYATDMHIIVRIPRLADVPENAEAPIPIFLFGEKDSEYKRFDIPDCEYKQSVCRVCNGAGRKARCPECGGNGWLMVESDYNEYQVDCKTCEGKRTIDICEECDGTGKIDTMTCVPLGGTFFQAKYLVMLKEIGCDHIGIGEDPLDGARFWFDGGEGLLMPRRE